MLFEWTDEYRLTHSIFLTKFAQNVRISMQNTNNAKTKLKDEKASEKVFKLYSRPFKIKCKNSNLTGYGINVESTQCDLLQPTLNWPIHPSNQVTWSAPNFVKFIVKFIVKFM